MREYQFDGLVGPTHNYGGLSPGNVVEHARRADVQPARGGAAGARQDEVRARPRRQRRRCCRRTTGRTYPRCTSLGFRGTDEEVDRGRGARGTRSSCGSRAARRRCGRRTRRRWPPRATPRTGRRHLTPANLQQMFHRAIEAGDDHPGAPRDLRRRRGASSCTIRCPGGGQLADEGAGEPHAPRDVARERAPLRVGAARLGRRRGDAEALSGEADARGERSDRAAPRARSRALSLPAAAPRRDRRRGVPHRRPRRRQRALLHAARARVRGRRTAPRGRSARACSATSSSSSRRRAASSRPRAPCAPTPSTRRSSRATTARWASSRRRTPARTTTRARSSSGSSP